MRDQTDELVPIVRAAGELSVGYLTARNLALRGELDLAWRGRNMFVSRSSLERLKGKRAATGEAAHP